MVTIVALSQMILYGCERRPLIEILPTEVPVPVEILWEDAGVIPQNVTLLVYDARGALFKEHIFENSGERVETTVNLPVGRYDVVVINELRNQIDHIQIRGHEHLTTLEAYITDATSVYNTKGRANGDRIVNQPGKLATLVKTIHITQEMLMEYNNGTIAAGYFKDEYFALTHLKPLLRTAVVDIKVKVKGINNARMPALAEVRNTAESYFIGEDRNSMNPVAIQFTVNNRIYNQGSMTDGEISATFACLGLMGKSSTTKSMTSTGILLNLWFQLVDKERTLISYEWDIAELFISNNNSNNTPLQLNLTSPDPLPDVKPEGATESGFSSDVVEWETENVQIYL